LDLPHIPNESDFRAVFYPPPLNNDQVKDIISSKGGGVGATSAVTRCGEHTDYKILTLMFQDNAGGLEVKKYKNDSCTL
jgi:isopenicillin N synthase-like dioxygenase